MRAAILLGLFAAAGAAALAVFWLQTLGDSAGQLRALAESPAALSAPATARSGDIEGVRPVERTLDVRAGEYLREREADLVPQPSRSPPPLVEQVEPLYSYEPATLQVDEEPVEEIPSVLSGTEFAYLLENVLLGEIDAEAAEEFRRALRESVAAPE